MRTISIPLTDLRPSVLCLGTADIGYKNTASQAHEIFDTFVKNGGTFFDTAHVYSDWWPGEPHRSERILGEWLDSSGIRKNLVIATKCGLHMIPNEGMQRFVRPEHIRKDHKESLELLRTGYIDLYYMHTDDMEVPVGEIIDALDELVCAGSVRHYACSNWSVDRMRMAQEYALKKGSAGFVANQMQWNAALYSIPHGPIAMNRTMYRFMQESKMTAVAWSSQANGFFTKCAQLKGVPDEGLRKSPYFNDSNMRLYRIVSDIAHRAGATVTETVLLYLMCQKLPAIPVIGAYTMRNLLDSLSAAGKTLSGELLEALDKAAGMDEGNSDFLPVTH